MRRSWLALAVGLALVLTSAGTAAATVTAGTGKAVTAAERLPDGDGPPGFWWGTDSFPVTVPGSAPYSMPILGGAYGGYIGMTGSWSYWLGCKGGFIAFSSTNAAQAHTNYVTYHSGVGDGAYWFMGGPGVDPNYNGTSTEASAWGARQAARALSDMANNGHIDYPVVWMDIELPGVAPAHDNGWNSVYTSPCSGVVKSPRRPGGRGPRGLQRVLRLHRRALAVQGRRLLLARAYGHRSSARAAPPRSRTPTSGPTSPRPPTSATPRTAGA